MVIIKVDNLGKKYILSHQRQGGNGSYATLREAIIETVKRRTREMLNTFARRAELGVAREEFWALKDISFAIERGERIGIIGRNGAGKTTLLKLLSRITEPTTGKILLKGRVASLLEIGTGFHGELTGRENIFLNGAILGMGRQEIRRKFEEIVSFAEVEKFIDTPVKRYSTGMHVRLAFAVAAHLEPEILLVDEVLAVGDTQFQKKCLGRMEKVSQEGRTVLFVSHNMQAIRSLCQRCIVFDGGCVIADAPTEEALSIYNQLLRGITIDATTGINNEAVRRGSGAIRFTSVEMLDVNGNKCLNFAMGETIRFKMSYKIFTEIEGLAVSIVLRSNTTREMVTSVKHVLSSDKVSKGTTGSVIVELPDIYIRPGEYPLYLWVGETKIRPTHYDVLDDITAPLIVTAGDKIQHPDFDSLNPLGCFSLPSRMLLNEIHKGIF